MTAISTSAVATGKPKFLQRMVPGIHEVEITGIKYGESTKNKTPYIEITFASKYEQHVETFYMAEGPSMQISLERIKHFATCIVTEEQLDNIKAATVTEYANKLSTAILGKSLRIKLVGEEEISPKTGKVYVKRKFGYYPWAESITVPATHSQLRYNPATNKNDYKALPKATEAMSDMDMGTPSEADKDDLPF